MRLEKNQEIKRKSNDSILRGISGLAQRILSNTKENKITFSNNLNNKIKEILDFQENLIKNIKNNRINNITKEFLNKIIALKNNENILQEIYRNNPINIDIINDINFKLPNSPMSKDVKLLLARILFIFFKIRIFNDRININELVRIYPNDTVGYTNYKYVSDLDEILNIISEKIEEQGYFILYHKGFNERAMSTIYNNMIFVQTIILHIKKYIYTNIIKNWITLEELFQNKKNIIKSNKVILNKNQSHSDKVNDYKINSQSNNVISNKSQSNKNQSQSNNVISNKSQFNKNQSQSNKVISNKSQSNKVISNKSQSNKVITNKSQSNKVITNKIKPQSYNYSPVISIQQKKKVEPTKSRFSTGITGISTGISKLDPRKWKIF